MSTGIDVTRIFNTDSISVLSALQTPGVAYYIPLYQREYSWDEENINQLMEDVIGGVKELVKPSDSIHFMGTLILVTERDPQANIKPQDPRALPPRIDNVIDGQQRLSTIALLGCQLYREIHQISQKLPKEQEYDSLREAALIYQKKLQELFSIDFGFGNPERKPLIIRGSVDGWTRDGDDISHYKSGVSLFLAKFIRAINNSSELPKPPDNSMVGKNLKRIAYYLKSVAATDKHEDDSFPTASQILETIPEENLWNYKRPEIVSKINASTPSNPKYYKAICSLIQTFAFCHYLMERCCFTAIRPVSDVRAFDMFQSLNGTGTPLTALETFKPLVVNAVDSNGAGFKESKSETYFQNVDTLLSVIRGTADKARLTNEYLTLFALTRDGSELYKRFSAQRAWLNDRFSACKSPSEQEEFVRQMGDLATYYSRVVNFNPDKSSTISGTEEVANFDKQLAAFCILYLRDAGHKISDALLSRFFALIIRENPNSAKEFVAAAKAVAAFFTLWRSALPNTGLDKVYKRLMREQISWEKGDDLLISQNLKEYFREALNSRGIGKKIDWKNKAVSYLRYDNATTVCRFALFVAAHDTIPDPEFLGLMKVATSGSSSYLDPIKWFDRVLTLEHVAPRQPESDGSWDAELYKANEYHQVGNLTLLPTKINSSLGNKGWIEKWIYYRHLAEQDPDKLDDLQREAKAYGITLKPETIELLVKTPYNHHIKPIISLGSEEPWNKSLVQQRTERICDILWERIYEWLI